MTVIARRFRSIPTRSALESWRAISELLAPEGGSSGRRELDRIAGVASSLVAREAMKDSAIVVYGSGPRVRVYCLYGEAAITDDASEQPLAFNATSGDWRISLPCPAEDLGWVRDVLKKESTSITARDLNEAIEEVPVDEAIKGRVLEVNREVFFRP